MEDVEGSRCVEVLNGNRVLLKLRGPQTLTIEENDDGAACWKFSDRMNLIACGRNEIIRAKAVLHIAEKVSP